MSTPVPSYPSVPVALTIAGSDSGGGAGIQADLRAFQAFGVFGLCAITAVTAQNSRRIEDLQVLAPERIRAQIRTACEGAKPGAVKIGMLGVAENIPCVAGEVKRLGAPLVVDPVFTATSGTTLLREQAAQFLSDHLFPLATLITPNIPEAELLLNRRIIKEKEQERAALELSRLWQTAVLLKGGHASPTREIIDSFALDGEVFALRHSRLTVANTHGTGCLLSSAAAACLAQGLHVQTAVMHAVAYVRSCLQSPRLLGAEQTVLFQPTATFKSLEYGECERCAPGEPGE